MFSRLRIGFTIILSALAEETIRLTESGCAMASFPAIIAHRGVVSQEEGELGFAPVALFQVRQFSPIQGKRGPKRRMKILEALYHRRHILATYDSYE